ncbi:MAG TPA: 3'(2'),5'-bisphosphate nucleotidase CysQ [Candidatus Acidoferrales bacterium]|nr:3'(2'),5'-bisphosphate nucleotidase CysQ [Candidatus Acidoferrales bacterium]
MSLIFDNAVVTNVRAANESLERIQAALQAALETLAPFTPGKVKAEQKSRGRGPVTEADNQVNRVLREALVRDGEGWLSEETVDDSERLAKQRVWIVDPLDGTKEFVAGIPEWCVSVALIEDGRAIAGGIANPATRETFLGSRETGVTYNGCPAQPSRKNSLEGAMVLASRSEVGRGEWAQFSEAPFTFRPMGSVAYKLALVAAGLADATWTLQPKNEWDIAAGVALVEAAGGVVQFLPNEKPAFNNRTTLLPGLFACGGQLREPIRAFLGPYAKATSSREASRS